MLDTEAPYRNSRRAACGKGQGQWAEISLFKPAGHHPQPTMKRPPWGWGVSSYVGVTSKAVVTSAGVTSKSTPIDLVPGVAWSVIAANDRQGVVAPHGRAVSPFPTR